MSKTYPIVETFSSIQGEGRWVGTPMYFIRFAGCPVPIAGKCKTWDGHPFTCDTDIRKREDVSLYDLAERALEHHRICFTGGEPFLYDLAELMYEMGTAHIYHIETSGTLQPMDFGRIRPWITVSPKGDYLKHWLKGSSEIKALVHRDTRRSHLNEHFGAWKFKTYLQPIDEIGDIGTHLNLNLERCIELVHDDTDYTLSVQLHKMIGVR